MNRNKRVLIANIFIVAALIIMFSAVIMSTLIKPVPLVTAASEKGEYFVGKNSIRICVCEEFETECSPCLKEPEK